MRVKASIFIFCFILFMNLAGSSLADEAIKYILPYPTANELYDAWSPDGVTYYFAGDAGTILKYDGASFTIMETPTHYPLFCIHGTSETDIWAAGGVTITAQMKSTKRCIGRCISTTTASPGPRLHRRTTLERHIRLKEFLPWRRTMSGRWILSILRRFFIMMAIPGA